MTVRMPQRAFGENKASGEALGFSGFDTSGKSLAIGTANLL